MSITSNLITLKEIVEKKYFFKVPIYQRLYVWEDKQITTLLEDLLTAYLDQKDIFYLGGVLVVEYDGVCFNQGRCFDLIDGQQRFTTLWMMSMVLPYSSKIKAKDSLHSGISMMKMGTTLE
jgi:uncharacterized protein with ParB-like and HNH nuclease domain